MNLRMYIELSRQKMLMLIGIACALLVSILVFLFVNGAWALVAHAEEKIAMSESQFWYWLFYQLPDGNAVSATSVPSGDARSIPVLLYHGEGATSDMPTSVFVDQMRALRAAGWRTITMEQFDAWERGQIQLPDKSFLLTFDDGRKDTYYQADPVLKDTGFQAVMFVITGFSLPSGGKQSDFYLNRTELADMVSSGRWELESHGNADHATYAVQSTTDLSQTASTTQGHFLSNKFWDTSGDRFETNAEFAARVEADMRASKETLESDFGGTVIAFAYPFNDYGQGTVNFPGSVATLDRIIPSIYAYTFYQTWSQNGDTFNYPLANNGPGTSAYMKKRIEPQASWSGQDLLSILDAASAKPLPYASASFGPEWVGTWGLAANTPEGLALAAKTQTSGAAAFLNGSGWWTNYYVDAIVNWQSGSNVSLLARNMNDVAYVACAFSATSVSIEQHFEGGQREIAAAHASLAVPSLRVDLGMAVSGSNVTCYENGKAVVGGSAPDMGTQGGIGIEIWDKTDGVARATVKKVSVSIDVPERHARSSAYAAPAAAATPAHVSALSFGSAFSPAPLPSSSSNTAPAGGAALASPLVPSLAPIPAQNAIATSSAATSTQSRTDNTHQQPTKKHHGYIE